MKPIFPARGLTCAALVLCICACTPAPPDSPPDTALHALHTGDVNALRERLGKGVGLPTRGRELRGRVDPYAWRIALGVNTRQHDTGAAAIALADGDEAALRQAISCDEETLRRDILDATHTVAPVRAGGRNFYRGFSAPVAAFDGWEFPALPAGALAYHTTALVKQRERNVRIHFGRDASGFTDLRAAVDITGERPHGIAGRKAAAIPDLLDAPLAGLDWAWTTRESVLGVSIALVGDDGRVSTARLKRSDEQWELVESASSTIAERMLAATDARLQRIQHAATQYARANAAWPKHAKLLNLTPGEWIDPGANPITLGWSEFDPGAQPGFELLQATEPEDIAVIALHARPEGRRAITRTGALIWATR